MRNEDIRNNYWCIETYNYMMRLVSTQRRLRIKRIKQKYDKKRETN